MRARIVRIGNSLGVRIPKPLIEQAGLGDEVTIEAEENCVVIRAARAPRPGWGEAFARMAGSGDDRLLDGGPPATSFDRSEGRWR